MESPAAPFTRVTVGTRHSTFDLEWKQTSNPEGIRGRPMAGIEHRKRPSPLSSPGGRGMGSRDEEDHGPRIVEIVIIMLAAGL